jgi:hypothetical protein
MRKTINQNDTTWGGQWHLTRILSKNFTEHGAWDNNIWYNPRGDFDWAAVDGFQIVAEHHNFKGMQFWFDGIRVAE